MYLPKVFEQEQISELFEFIRQWSFAELITTFNKELFVNHVPFFVDEHQNKLYGHLAIKNPQVALLESADQLMVVFKGADSYISPAWYTSEQMVPTWNYEVVHVLGKATLIYDEPLMALLEKLTKKHEEQFESSWEINSLSENNLNRMMEMIVGFEIDILSIKGKTKLSQNRSREDRVAVVSGLRAKNDSMSEIIADKMELNI